jgi:hypothetical protein
MKIVPVQASVGWDYPCGRRTLRGYEYRLRALRVSSRSSREYGTTDALTGKRRSPEPVSADEVLAKGAKRREEREDSRDLVITSLRSYGKLLRSTTALAARARMRKSGAGHTMIARPRFHRLYLTRGPVIGRLSVAFQDSLRTSRMLKHGYVLEFMIKLKKIKFWRARTCRSPSAVSSHRCPSWK